MEMNEELQELLLNMQKQGYTHFYIDIEYEEVEFYESIDFNHPRAAFKKSAELKGTPVEWFIDYMEANDIEDSKCYAISDEVFLGSPED